MKDYFVALEPEKKLHDFILDSKKWIKDNLGDQLYLGDKPHLTLGVLCAENLCEIEEVCSKQSKLQKKLTLSIEKLTKFPLDSVTNKYPLCLEISGENLGKLKSLQSDLLNKLNIFREKNIALRYFNSSFNGKLKKNLEKFGYPFVGEIWLPHISFCSFDNQKDLDFFLEKNYLEKFKGDFLFEKLALYKLYQDDSSELIRYFELQ